MIEFNSKHFSAELKGNYREVNLLLRNSDGQIFGGLS